MKAILLAAGLGTRLRPITNHVPKCLVPVGGKPLLAYWLDIMDSLGIEEILLNQHYLPEKVQQFVENHPLRNKIKLVYEPDLIGTGGTLVAQRDFWKDSDTLVIHADNFCLSNLHGMRDMHALRGKGIATTLLVFRSEDPQSCGVVERNEHNVVTAFHEKVANPPSNLASGAVALFEAGVYQHYFAPFESKAHGLDFSKSILPTMVNHMQTWEVDAYYADIGNPRALELANKVVQNQH